MEGVFLSHLVLTAQSFELKFRLKFQPVQYSRTGTAATLWPPAIPWKYVCMAVIKAFPGTIQ